MKKLFAFALALLCLFTSVSLGSSAGILEASDDSRTPYNAPKTADGYTIDDSAYLYIDKPTDDVLIKSDILHFNELARAGLVDSNDYRSREPSYNYNCHSFAWWSTDANHYWINNISEYIACQHCGNAFTSNPKAGDIIVYISNNQIAHSAIVLSNNNGKIMCWSKWGNGGVYTHQVDHVPREYLDNGKLNALYYTYPIHSYGSWQDYSSTYHIKKCTKGLCDEKITGTHTYGSWQQTNNSVHTKYCTVCNRAETASHTLSYININSSSTHNAKCSTCGKVFSQQHTFGSWVNANATNHTRTCSKCNYSQSASHSFTVYSQTGSTSTHNVKCSSCSRTISESHAITRWVSSGPSGHKGTCNKCGQSVTRAHTFSGTACTVCGYTGPGVIDGQDPIDE